MAKKVMSQRKHGDEQLEAPRNSLELMAQTCPGGVGDYLQIPRQDKNTSKTTSRRSTPSVVARLMGMDIDMFPTSDSHHQRKQVQSLNIKSEEGEEHRQHVIDYSNHLGEHPQEKELQRFKKEFESWQPKARFKRTSPEQLLVHEIAHYSGNEKKPNHDAKSRLYFDHRLGNYSSPNKIVILRPGCIDHFGNPEEESWVGGSSFRKNSIEEFLEEVNERLKSEFQGKYCHNKKGTSEKPLDAMKKEIAKQVREREIQIIKETNSSRHVLDDSVHIMHHHREWSLTRSLSAPDSGTSFGKLLLEDRHVLKGAHLQRKHEVVEKRMKKEKLEPKKTVSNYKHRFTLGEQLFQRRFQSTDDVYSSRNDIMSGPTIIMNYGNIQENATEVPPSPASSLSESSPLRDSSLPQEFREINFSLSELRRQLNALDNNSSNEAGSEEDELMLSEITEDPAETHIREFLIASGHYYHFNSTTLFRGMEKPINNQVFNEMEKSYTKWSNNNEQSKINRQILCNSTNEAIVGQSTTVPTWSRNKLLNSVRERIRTYSTDATESEAWTMQVKVEEVDYIVKEVETRIISSLIEEVIKDLQQLHLERRWRRYNR